MSGHCPQCGTYHEEDDDRVCSKCASSSEPKPEKLKPEDYVSPTIHVMNGMAVSKGGLTLRDYFAGQALPAIIAATVAAEGHIMKTRQVEMAYEYADAMEEARTSIEKAEGGGA